MPTFPRASHNVMAATMIMRMALEPSTNEGKRVHKELQGLLETMVVQQAQSSVERRHPEAILVHITSAHNTLNGHHMPNMP